MISGHTIQCTCIKCAKGYWSYRYTLTKITERESKGLNTVDLRNRISWQGDRNYTHFDMETIRELSNVEFIENNICEGEISPFHAKELEPHHKLKYDKALSWEEIELIQDITK